MVRIDVGCDRDFTFWYTETTDVNASCVSPSTTIVADWIGAQVEVAPATIRLDADAPINCSTAVYSLFNFSTPLVYNLPAAQEAATRCSFDYSSLHQSMHGSDFTLVVSMWDLFPNATTRRLSFSFAPVVNQTLFFASNVSVVDGRIAFRIEPLQSWTCCAPPPFLVVDALVVGEGVGNVTVACPGIVVPRHGDEYVVAPLPPSCSNRSYETGSGAFVAYEYILRVTTSASCGFNNTFLLNDTFVGVQLVEATQSPTTTPPLRDGAFELRIVETGYEVSPWCPPTPLVPVAPFFVVESRSFWNASFMSASLDALSIVGAAGPLTVSAPPNVTVQLGASSGNVTSYVWRVASSHCVASASCSMGVAAATASAQSTHDGFLHTATTFAPFPPFACYSDVGYDVEDVGCGRRDVAPFIDPYLRLEVSFSGDPNYFSFDQRVTVRATTGNFLAAQAIPLRLNLDSIAVAFATPTGVANATFSTIDKLAKMGNASHPYHDDAHFCRYRCGVFPDPFVAPAENASVCADVGNVDADAFSFVPREWPEFSFFNSSYGEWRVTVAVSVWRCDGTNVSAPENVTFTAIHDVLSGSPGCAVKSFAAVRVTEDVRPDSTVAVIVGSVLGGLFGLLGLVAAYALFVRPNVRLQFSRTENVVDGVRGQGVGDGDGDGDTETGDQGQGAPRPPRIVLAAPSGDVVRLHDATDMAALRGLVQRVRTQSAAATGVSASSSPPVASDPDRIRRRVFAMLAQGSGS